MEIVQLSAQLISYQGTDFPLSFGLSAPDLGVGFVSTVYQNSAWITHQTDIISTANPVSIQSTSQTGGAAYNIIYRAGNDYAWNIGMAPVLTLRIVD